MDTETKWGLGALLSLIWVLILVTAGAHLGAWIYGGPELPVNPFGIILGTAAGEITISTPVLVVTGIVVGVGVLGAVTLGLVMYARAGGAKRGDKAARLTGSDASITPLLLPAVAKKAASFGMDPKLHPGQRLGRTVRTRKDVYASWEDVTCNIWGPRTGKTTSQAVPLTIAAPGAVIATSNKRDLVDGTRLVREQRTGARTWVFDPLDICGATPDMWWNPLSYITGEGFSESTYQRGKALAEIFIDGSKKPDAREDAFFSGKSRELITWFVIAAALGQRPLTDVYDWVTAEVDDTPVRILADHGQQRGSRAVDAAMSLNPETKAGVFSGALQAVEWLADPTLVEWTSPSWGRAEFRPEKFVQSNETLYSISREGTGAGPLVTALTVVTMKAAETYANACGGRMPTPMVVVLDEAANVCRWNQLPDMYSHYGSKGLCVHTILQSWSQGVRVWSEAGMKQLWDASNVRIYGGGTVETGYLDQLSQVIGEHYVDSRQSSSGRSGRSSSTTYESNQRKIATVAELSALPRGRAWLFGSGATAVLIEPIPWYTTPDAPEVNRSIKKYGVTTP